MPKKYLPEKNLLRFVRIKAVSSSAAQQTAYFSFVLESTFMERGISKDFKRRFDAKCYSIANSTKTTIFYFKKLRAL